MKILLRCPANCTRRFTCHRGIPIPVNKMYCYKPPTDDDYKRVELFVKYINKVSGNNKSNSFLSEQFNQYMTLVEGVEK